MLPKRWTKVPESAPVQAPAEQAKETLPLRLKLIPFEIEIPTVSEEVYAETRKAVETAIPGVFITSIRPVTMEDLLTEDGQRGERGQPKRLGYVNDSKIMRAVFPPEMEVFINPNAVRIEGSNGLSTDQQKRKIMEEEARFKAKLPKAVRPFVSLLMVDPSTMSQVEDRYMDENNGALLFPDFFGRTDVQTVQDLVAYVGRYDPNCQRSVHEWYRGNGYGHVFAVPVGVLPRKLTA